jgi:nucleotide sugar dehydrogenase
MIKCTENIIGVIGLGFVGEAIYRSFLEKLGSEKYLVSYDKYKDGGIGTFHDILCSNIVFLCLPTQFSYENKQYDKSAIYDTCDNLVQNNYQGLVVIKSTIEPQTTKQLSEKYDLKFVHNPEFLTAKTAFRDFHNQKHIILGKSKNCTDTDLQSLVNFYKKHYQAQISTCTSTESELTKICVNNFYASKIQLFNEYYLLCNKIGSDFGMVRNLMLKNDWIHPMHTKVPGTDGQLSYGGYCFPKDTNALLNFMKVNNTKHDVLESVIKERNEMRDDHTNTK